MKMGLEYFPFDCGFFDDEKVAAIAGEYGLKGEMVTVKLLCAIYRNGYFYEWNDLHRAQMLRRLPGVSAELLNQIVNRLVKWGFFDKGLFDSVGVLTSVDIQRVFLDATKRRRNARGPYPHMLIESDGHTLSEGVNVDKNPGSKGVFADNNPPGSGQTRPEASLSGVNVDNNPLSTVLNADNNAQSKVKESKVNVVDDDVREAEVFESFRPTAAWLEDWLLGTPSIEQWCATRRITRADFERHARAGLADMMLFHPGGYQDKTEALRHLQGLINKKIVAAATQTRNENANQQTDIRDGWQRGRACARPAGTRQPPPPDCGLVE